MSQPTPTQPALVLTEPYRLFFPIGLLSLGLGLGIWLPALWLTLAYPGVAHAGLQIQGYLLAFILGFLMTMLPKALGLSAWSRFNLGTIAVLLFAHIAASLQARYALMTWLHLGLMVYVVIQLVLRFRQRRNPQQSPPTPFRLIAAGLMSDVLGTLLIALHLSTDWLGDAGGFAFELGRLLQNQAFPLLLIAGVGSFLLPRLFAGHYREPGSLPNTSRSGALNSDPSVVSLLKPRPTDRGPAFYWSIAALILVGSGLEASRLGGDALGLRLGYLARFAAVAIAFFLGIGLHRLKLRVPGYLLGARWGLWCIVIGLFMPVIDPAHRLGYAHLVYIGGYGWLTLSVASRVLASHGGMPRLVEGMRPWVKVSAACMILAMLSRVTAEFGSSIWPAWHRMGLTLAIVAMLVGFGVWAFRFAPGFIRKPN